MPSDMPGVLAGRPAAGGPDMHGLPVSAGSGADTRGLAAGMLDGYANNLWGAYSLGPLLLGKYAGPLIRVRRSSDNAEQDIFLKGTGLDLAAIASFVGSTGDGFVSKWYDQSGGGNDLAQSTAANQPQVVVSGAYTNELLFDGVNDELVTANNSGGPTAFVVFIAGRSRRASDTVTLVRQAGSAATLQSVRNVADADKYRGNVSTGAGTAAHNDSYNTDGTAYGGFMDRDGAAIGDECKLYVNGVVQTVIATSGVVSTGTYTPGTWSLGSAGGSLWSRLAVRTFLICEAAAAIDISRISTLVKPAVPVDGFSSDLTSIYGLYSLRRQNRAYLGSSIRVRRSSDNTEQDVGFVNGLLDTASMLAFTGANNGFVTKFYDQSGNGRDFVQATAANQPQIVTSGAVTSPYGMKFDGVDDHLDTTVNGAAVPGLTLYAKALAEVLANSAILELTANSNGVNGALWIYGNTTDETGVRVSGAAGNGQSNYDSNITSGVQTAVMDRAQSTVATQTVLYSGGAQITAASTSGSTQSGNFQADKWHLGARSTGVIPFNGEVETIAIYETVHNAATIDRLSRAIG